MAKKKKSAASKDYRVTKKRSGRYSVTTKNGRPVNGLDKVKVLLGEGLIKTGLPKEGDAAEPAAAEGGEAAAETPAE